MEASRQRGKETKIQGGKEEESNLSVRPATGPITRPVFVCGVEKNLTPKSCFSAIFGIKQAVHPMNTGVDSY
jgi:hypothetical protein